jgi:hypothetical protein
VSKWPSAARYDAAANRVTAVTAYGVRKLGRASGGGGPRLVLAKLALDRRIVDAGWDRCRATLRRRGGAHAFAEGRSSLRTTRGAIEFAHAAGLPRRYSFVGVTSPQSGAGSQPAPAHNRLLVFVVLKPSDFRSTTLLLRKSRPKRPEAQSQDPGDGAKCQDESCGNNEAPDVAQVPRQRCAEETAHHGEDNHHSERPRNPHRVQSRTSLRGARVSATVKPESEPEPGRRSSNPKAPAVGELLLGIGVDTSSPG